MFLDQLNRNVAYGSDLKTQSFDRDRSFLLEQKSSRYDQRASDITRELIIARSL